jgi:maltose/moltooligosaccharide transporter
VIMPKLMDLTSRKFIFSISLLLGGLGFVSTFFFSNQYMLLFSMVGIGIAWAAILAIPYAILSGSLPAKRMGIYMGLFNLTVVVPQIISGVFGGPILRSFFGGEGIYILVLAGAIMILGAISVRFVDDQKIEIDPVTEEG